MRLAVVGASGRMGRAVVRLAGEARDVEIVGAVATTEVGKDVGELAGLGSLGVMVSDSLEVLAGVRADVVIDFSSPQATRALAEVVAGHKIALVSGTTGLGGEAAQAIEQASTRTAVLWEPNMSLGVHVLGVLLQRAITLLGPGFDVEIVEAHHKLKVDAPSGTALRLAHLAARARADEAEREARGEQPSTFVYGREGRPGERRQAEIGVLAMRGGDVVGDHTVHLFGAGERLELTHRATSRDLFARGALVAARVLARKPPGRYTLADVAGA